MAVVVVVDADINHRLASELKKRGRDAVAAQELLIKRAGDPILLQHLHDKFGRDGYVLLTGDDKMPFQHEEHVARLGCTIATIDPHRGSGYEDDRLLMKWRNDVGHRWFHVICEQPLGTIYRYGRQRRLWTVRLKERTYAGQAGSRDAEGLQAANADPRRGVRRLAEGGEGEAG